MSDSYFVFGVLAMIAMVLGVRSARRSGDETDDGPDPGSNAVRLPKGPKPTPGRSRGKQTKPKRGEK
jgi:hypothetical protein